MAYVIGFLLAPFLGIIPAAIAANKGHSSFLWWVFGTLLFIVALPISLTLQPNTQVLEKRAITEGGGRKCPFCAEVIKREASVCRFCGRDLPGIEPSSLAPRPIALDPEGTADLAAAAPLFTQQGVVTTPRPGPPMLLLGLGATVAVAVVALLAIRRPEAVAAPPAVATDPGPDIAGPLDANALATGLDLPIAARGALNYRLAARNIGMKGLRDIEVRCGAWGPTGHRLAQATVHLPALSQGEEGHATLAFHGVRLSQVARTRCVAGGFGARAPKL